MKNSTQIIVMAGLVPAIYENERRRFAWIAGTRPAMTGVVVE